jgi:hypothetical protein
MLTYAKYGTIVNYSVDDLVYMCVPSNEYPNSRFLECIVSYLR